MNKYLISPLLLSILLQGCGGSSSSSPTEPPLPVERTFTFTSQLTNNCGISSAFTDVELLLQDDTWQTLEVYQPDENGEISFITNDEFINYTLVAKNQQGSEVEGLNVVSFYQASSETPAHYQAQYDNLVENASCECITQHLNLTHAPLQAQSSVSSSASYSDWQEVDSQNTLFKNVQICRGIDGEWPLHSFSVGGLALNGGQVAVGEFFNLNDEADSSAAWSIFAILPATSYSLTAPHQDVISHQVIQGAKHFATQVAKNEQSILVFDNHIYTSENHYQSQAGVTFSLVDSSKETAVSKNIHRVTSTSVDTSLDLVASIHKPAFDSPKFEEIKSDSSYDYSSIAGFPMAVISYTFFAFDANNQLLPAKWTFYGPEKGTLAISVPLPGYENIINDKTRKDAIDVRLVNSKSSKDYMDYIKHYQGDSSDNLADDFTKDMTAVELELKYY